MTQSKTPLEALLDHPSQSLVITIVTFIVAVVGLWPAVDEYLTVDYRVTELTNASSLAEIELEVVAATENDYQQIQETKLEPLLNRNIDSLKSSEIRREFVKAVRETGSTLRKLELGEPVISNWIDNPQLTSTKKKHSSPYRIETRELRVTLLGDYTALHQFITKIDKIDSYIDDYDVQLKTKDSTGEQLQLDIKMKLLGLIKVDPKKKET